MNSDDGIFDPDHPDMKDETANVRDSLGKKSTEEEIFQVFGDEFFASRGKPSKEAIDTLHAAMDSLAGKPKQEKNDGH